MACIYGWYVNSSLVSRRMQGGWSVGSSTPFTRDWFACTGDAEERPLEVKDPPSGTYVKVLPVASSMEPMKLGQTDLTTVVNREVRDILDHTCDRLST